MAEFFKASRDIMSKGIDSLKTIKQDKFEYKQYEKRVKALPEDYRFVFEKITDYMWNYSGSSDGYDMVAIHEGLLELFESGAAEGKKVLEVTGKDVAAFCDELLRNARTYIGDRREKLNNEIKKKLGEM